MKKKLFFMRLMVFCMCFSCAVAETIDPAAWDVIYFNRQAASFPSAFDIISTRSTHRKSRTAIGMISPLHYVILVLDGYQPGYSDGFFPQILHQL